jgi:tetratricopeptide (TPR) repeat protein
VGSSEAPAAEKARGDTLLGQRKFAEAAEAYRNAIRLGPGDAQLHSKLAVALTEQGKLDEAIAERSEAVRLDPRSAYYRDQLGWALQQRGKLDEAVAQLREAIRIDPDHANAQNSLGFTLQKRGKQDEAVNHYRNAIRVKPDYAEAHCNLGLVLQRQGHYEQALASLRRGHELGSKRPGWRYPSASWVRQCEHLVRLKARLPALLKVEKQPQDNADRLSLAQFCQVMRLYAAAARFRGAALASGPKLGEGRRVQRRYQAARDAAVAGSGQGEDNPKPDEAARARLRKTARGWLGEELASWARIAESGGAEDRATVARTLTQWKHDTVLAGVRDADALAKLPDPEKRAWRALWAEVDAVVRKAQGTPPNH